VTGLQLGNVTYTQEQLLAILRERVRANGLLILAKQEIAAKLNIANGADGSCIQQTLADADALIEDLVIPPIGDGYLRPRDVSPTAGILGDYNEGNLCAPSCDNGGRLRLQHRQERRGALRCCLVTSVRRSNASFAHK
jgi:hypothetical protein